MAGAGYRHSTVIHESLQESYRNAGPGRNIAQDRLLKWGTQGSTIHLVSNCEDVTDWDISDSSNFNAVDDGTDYRVGSNAIELVDAGTTTGTYVTLDDGHKPDGEDWTDFNWICMWVHDDTAARTAGELKFQIKNAKDWNTAISVPINSNADMYELKTISIADCDRANVTGFRFVNNRGTGSSEKVYVDYIFVTDLVTGLGTGLSLCTGPVIGPVRSFPVATGATIVPGDTVEWGAFGVNTGTANDERIIGVACQNVSTTSTVAADATPKEILVACEGAIVWMRNDGSGMAVGEPGLLGSDVVTEAAGSATANAERAFCMSLENAATTEWASGDSAYQLMSASTED